jgi:hypothetical protein
MRTVSVWRGTFDVVDHENVGMRAQIRGCCTVQVESPDSLPPLPPSGSAAMVVRRADTYGLYSEPDLKASGPGDLVAGSGFFLNRRQRPPEPPQDYLSAWGDTDSVITTGACWRWSAAMVVWLDRCDFEGRLRTYEWSAFRAGFESQWLRRSGRGKDRRSHLRIIYRPGAIRTA